MFLERLSTISSRIEGAEALSLVAEDGIPIESVNASNDLDLELLAAELVSQARSISSDQRELAVGEVQQFSVTTDRYTFIVSAVAEKLSAMKTAQYFADRAQRGDLQAALALLGRSGGQPPADDDRLPA